MIDGGPNQKDVSRRLLAWYARAGRDLPWRRRSDAYAVWIAEVMLQQTRVQQAGPYYERWLAAFGDVASLAAAKLEQVLKAWEGLGYYARARNLHAAAGQVVREFGGQLPQTVEELRRLRGVGRYTAGAIASIAFGRDEPVLDGNVTRVLCRLACIRDAPSAGRQRRLWELARQLIPPGRAGAFNQAMMDLGATVCTPRRPACLTCPLRNNCRAHALGCEESLPRRTPRPPVPHFDAGVGVVLKRGRVLIDLRPSKGLLGGLWEFPGGKMQPGEDAVAAVRRELREEVGIEVRVVGPLATVRHAYSHFRVTLHAMECRHVSGRARALGCAAVRWVGLDELEAFAFPRATRRIIAALRGE